MGNNNRAMSSRKYCKYKPSTDMIRMALEKKGAFTSSAFRTISKDPPKISVEYRADGGAEVAVTLTSMPFISSYRDPRSPERKKLEKDAREEIIRSFDLQRDRVGDGDIEIDIREGSVEILIILCQAIVSIATATIAALCTAPKANTGAIMAMGAGATGAVAGAVAGSEFGPPGMGVGAIIGFVGGALFGKCLAE